QSTPVSDPFLTPSEQLGFWQTLPVQTPLMQLPPFAQPWPAGQSAQLGPQSRPVLLPIPHAVGAGGGLADAARGVGSRPAPRWSTCSGHSGDELRRRDLREHGLEASASLVSTCKVAWPFGAWSAVVIPVGSAVWPCEDRFAPFTLTRPLPAA